MGTIKKKGLLEKFLVKLQINVASRSDGDFFFFFDTQTGQVY